MKKAIKTLAVVTLAFMPLAASAQENISKAIDLFGADTGTYGIWNKTEDRDSKGIFSTIYKFKLPKKQEKKLNFLREAFYKDLPKAYDSFIKKSGRNSKANKLIAYGVGLDERMALGWPNDKEDKNYLYMFVTDTTNTDYRYVYGLEWYYKGRKVVGSVVEIYSRDPKKAKAKGCVTVVNGEDVDLSDLNSLGDRLKGLKSIDSLLGVYNVTTTSGSSVITTKDGKTILKSDKQCLIVNKDGSLFMDDGEGNTTTIDRKGNVTSTSHNSAPVSTDPLQKFANLRAAYINNIREGNVDNTTLLTGLANSILDFCKNQGKKMSYEERQVCIDGLKDLQEQTLDKFIKGVFGVAISELSSRRRVE